MSLLLAIEPDTPQADALRQIVRDRIGAELMLVTSTATAVAAMNQRVPDLLLFSASISTVDQRRLVRHFRSLTLSPDPPALIIPRLRRDGEPREITRLGFPRRHQTPGSSHAEFAGLIADALGRVEDARLRRGSEPDSPRYAELFAPRSAEPPDGPSDWPLAGKRGEPVPDDELAGILRSIDAVLERSSAEEPADPASSEKSTAWPIVGQPVSGQTPEAVSASLESDTGFAAAELHSLTEELDLDMPLAAIDVADHGAVVQSHDEESASSGPEGTIRGAGFWSRLLRSRPAKVEADIHAEQDVTGITRRIGSEEEEPFTAELQVAADTDGTLNQFGRAPDDAERPQTRQVPDDVDVARIRADAIAIAVTEARAVSEAESRNALSAELAKVRSAAEDALTETMRHVRSEAEQTLAAELSRIRAESERTVNELGLARAEADGRERSLVLGDADATVLRAAAVEEARRVAEEAAARAVAAELARGRQDSERLQTELEHLRQSAHAERLAEHAANVEAELLRDEASRKARDAASQAAAVALETQVAQVRTDAEHRLDAILERVRDEVERTRRTDQSETRSEVERLFKSAASDFRSTAEEAAAHALEAEVARMGAEAETRLQAEVTRLRMEVEHFRLSGQADARIEAERIRETAAQEARAIAEVTLKAELERVRIETRARLDAEVASLRATAEKRYETDVLRLREQIAQRERTADVQRSENARQTVGAKSDRGIHAGEQHRERGRSNAHVQSWRSRVSDWRRPAIWTLSAAALGVVLIAGASRVGDVAAAVRGAERAAAAWFNRGDTAAAPPDTASITTAAAASSSPQFGELRVESTPSGAQVILDGRERGLSPLTLTGIRAGRHALVLRGEGGTVTRTVTVRAHERTVATEQIIPGFLTVFSRLRLDVSVGGRRIGTTEDGQLLVAPGRHAMTLTNTHFNYRSTVTVDVQPGAVTSYTVSLPNGSLRVNAIPGAEVWIEGERMGTAPLGELSVPIGTREVVVKDPEHGERRQFVEVRYGQPTEVTIALNTIANEDRLVRLAP